jgi:hypothetical protein
MSEQSTGIDRIAAERQRQIDAEGYSPEHDLEHTNSALAFAAACYAVPGAIYRVEAKDGQVTWWEPWPHGWRRRLFPHSDSTESRLRDLEKAGALIAAEIDRIVTSGTWNPRESRNVP